MKKILFLMISLSLATLSFAQKFNQKFISTDIDNFWIAYDKIISTNDSVQQYSILKEFYLNKATLGLKSISEVRNYTEKDFINAINNYPKFWNSIRANTLNAKSVYP
jgi:hypothetical protein